jgi:hypothetical protein
MDDAYKAMCHDLIDLIVNFGLMSAIIDQFPEHVRDSFVERMDNVCAFANAQIREIQQFGEAFDDADAG